MLSNALIQFNAINYFPKNALLIMYSLNHLFINYQVDYEKLKEYGFIIENNEYVFNKQLNDNLIMKIIINKDINLYIFDKDFNDECLNYELSYLKNMWVNYVNDIKEKCFILVKYNNKQALEIDNYIKEKYKIDAEFMFSKFPHFGVYKINNKWFSMIMNIDYKLIDKNKSGQVYVINLKNDNVENLINEKGFYKAYHMNKKYWITICLDDKVDINKIFSLIDKSFELVYLNKKQFSS